MTILNKKVKRETQAYYQRRHLVIQIEPPNLISIKEKGRRKWITIPIESLWTYANMREAERLKSEKVKCVCGHPKKEHYDNVYPNNRTICGIWNCDCQKYRRKRR